MEVRKRKWLTTWQIAEMLGVSDQSVTNWINEGLLTAQRTPGGHRRIDSETLKTFLRGRKIDVPAELRTSPPTILIVDDEAKVTHWLEIVLTKEFRRCRILTAASGYDAGRIITSERPDVVVLDLYMPGIDGFNICRQIKSDPLTSGTGVVAITGQPSPQAEKAIMEAGAVAYLSKPLTARRISDIVGRLLPK